MHIDYKTVVAQRFFLSKILKIFWHAIDSEQTSLWSDMKLDRKSFSHVGWKNLESCIYNSPVDGYVSSISDPSYNESVKQVARNVV